ncbi:hypothetical protein EP331_15400 [bacterium]|nr:MAG: hypothetical protein EP331_15400 [bacterium]
MYLKSDLEVFEFSKINPKNRIQGAAYVDSVQFANKHHTNGLNIFGNTPDGCSKIDIKSSFQNDSLIVTIISTKERDQMCTMALTPFRYFVPFETLGVRTENQPSLKYIQVNQINVKPNL